MAAGKIIDVAVNNKYKLIYVVILIYHQTYIGEQIYFINEKPA
jgi:hypothetical protein